jgi:hypothetical protein
LFYWSVSIGVEIRLSTVDTIKRCSGGGTRHGRQQQQR